MTNISFFLMMIVCILATLSPFGASASDVGTGVRVLFVGNSLTYVGNLPAVLEALGTSNGKAISTEMLVSGGATLADRLNDSSLRRLLDSRSFDYVVLQERGGDALCIIKARPGEICDSSKAHIELGKLIRSHGAKPIVLGTYQQLEPVSRALEENEALIAKKIGAIHIRVSEIFRRSRAKYKMMNWYDADGSHPGPDLTLLEAIRLYSVIIGASPSPHALKIANAFGPSAYFSGSSVASSQPSLEPAAPWNYELHRVAEMVEIASVGRSTATVTTHHTRQPLIGYRRCSTGGRACLPALP